MWSACGFYSGVERSKEPEQDVEPNFDLAFEHYRLGILADPKGKRTFKIYKN